MSHQLWLADAARRWGLVVLECDGWQTRGSSDFSPRGIVAHHTAGPGGGGDMPSLGVLINGRADLAGPLCNYGLGRSGTVYVVASGRANHAGSGGWRGLTGNSSVVGIEAENDGYQPWPDAQLVAYRRLGAAICEALSIDPAYLCRHHEWRSEKPDPHDLDGDSGRANVAALLAIGPTPTPPEEEPMRATYVLPTRDPAGKVYLAGLAIDPRPVGLFTDVEWTAAREGIEILDAPESSRRSIGDGAGNFRWVWVMDDASIFGL